MPRKRTLIIVSMCMTLAAILLQPAAFTKDEKKPVRVGYHFTTDYSQDYKSEYSQTYEVQGYSFFHFWDIEYTEKCTQAIDDTLFYMELTVHKVSGAMRRNDDLTEYDEAEEVEGKKFTFKINHHGMLSDLESEEYLNFEDEALGILEIFIASAYPYLPDEDLPVGGEWSFNGSTVVDRKSEFDIESSESFTVEEMKKEKGKQCYKIISKSEEYVSGRLEGEGGKFVMDGEGDGEGEYYFDIENNVIVKMRNKTDVLISYISASGSSADEREAQETNVVINVKRELK